MRLRKAEVSKATIGRGEHTVAGLEPTSLVGLGTESWNTRNATLEGRT